MRTAYFTMIVALLFSALQTPPVEGAADKLVVSNKSSKNALVLVQLRDRITVFALKPGGIDVIALAATSDERSVTAFEATATFDYVSPANVIGFTTFTPATFPWSAMEVQVHGNDDPCQGIVIPAVAAPIPTSASGTHYSLAGGLRLDNKLTGSLRVTEPVDLDGPDPAELSCDVDDVLLFQLQYPIAPPFPDRIEAYSSSTAAIPSDAVKTDGVVAILTNNPQTGPGVGVGFISVFAKAYRPGRSTITTKVRLADGSVKEVRFRVRVLSTMGTAATPETTPVGDRPSNSGQPVDTERSAAEEQAAALMLKAFENPPTCDAAGRPGTGANVKFLGTCPPEVGGEEPARFELVTGAWVDGAAKDKALFVTLLFVRNLDTGKLVHQSSSSLMVAPGLNDCSVHSGGVPTAPGRYRARGEVRRLLSESPSESEWKVEDTVTCNFTVN